MSKWINIVFGALAIFSSVPHFGFSANLTLIDASGQSTEVYIDPSDRFQDVMQFVGNYFQEGVESDEEVALPICYTGLNQEPTALTFIVSNSDITIRKKSAGRNYSQPVSKQEKKDIAYIVNTLAKESLISIANAKSSLKKAGERIDHVHPLRFLMTIFTDEELKAGVHAIRGRTSWIADEFFSGIVGSLSEEASKQNLKPEFIQDFAGQVNISTALILPPIQQARWKDFVNVLIDNIPRSNDPNRYNM
ncbi:hypothetical protein [Candidatus Protochlamydia phocaeensis]|uniref:hypothetical protein n=1 Tax=Candidatus Protochlamydia phocaeensis TaxID=1414722 RepID=UPI000837CFED|nr:hypothetical protein [Candidatus Protochlamydia phocaeensis]